MVRLWILRRRFLARNKQMLWCLARGVNGQLPSSSMQYGGQTEINRIGAGIEHQVQSVALIFLDQTGKLFLLRAGPVGQSSLRRKPMNLSILVELLTPRSSAILSRSGASASSLPLPSRPRTEAKSNRNPSTCISTIQ